jgi:hypothetical protein
MAQIEPVQNSEQDLHSLRVKTISSYFFTNNSPASGELLILNEEYDSEGKMLKKYQLYLWDAVSYSYTTTFIYNEKGLLMETLKIQEILNLYKRDDDYIRSFGDKPLNEKIMYYYNDRDQLSKKDIFIFNSESPDKALSPSQSINYEYENNLLVAEESVSSDEKIFNRNYVLKYQYDSLGNLKSKSMAYGKELELKRMTSFIYDDRYRIIEEKITDVSVPHNNARYKYEYNDNGLLIQKYIFNEEEDIFELDKTYTYDENGNIISGDRETSFEYYKNGLIKSESWTNPVTDEIMTFRTTYEYY